MARDALRNGGNPYHDAEGKFTTGGAHGRKPREGRKPRSKARLEAFRKHAHKQTGGLRKEHSEGRKGLVAEQKAERKDIRKEHREIQKEWVREKKAEQKELLKDQASERRERLSEIKAEHAGEIRELKASQRADIREASSEHRQAQKRYEKTAEKLRARNQEERARRVEILKGRHQEAHDQAMKDIEKEHAEAVKDLTEEHVEHLKDEMAELRQSHRKQIADMKVEHAESKEDLKTEQKQEREDRRAQQREERQSLIEDQREERQALLTELKEKLHEHFGDHRKPGSRSVGGLYHGELARDAKTRRDDDGSTARRFAGRRTHKAGSAESILRHCLRSHGWSRQFTRSELSGSQHYAVLESIREYGRSWMHDEAISLLREHGSLDRALEVDLIPAVRRFFGRARAFIGELIHAGVQALWGPGRIDHAAETAIDVEIRRQSEYLDNWYHDVILNPPEPLRPVSPEAPLPTPETEGAKPPSGKEFAARAELYGSSVWGAAQNPIRHRAMAVGRFREERRVHQGDEDDRCRTCKEYSVMTHDGPEAGWATIGTLPAIGDSDCQCNCHCLFEVRENPGNPSHILLGPFAGTHYGAQPPREEEEPEVEMVAELAVGTEEEHPVSTPPEWEVPF
jgi:hypothetical protein